MLGKIAAAALALSTIGALIGAPSAAHPRASEFSTTATPTARSIDGRSSGTTGVEQVDPAEVSLRRLGSDGHISASLIDELDRGSLVTSQPFVAGDICLGDTSPTTLGTLFDTEPGGIIGADYPRTLSLPNGNVLWTFQDAKVRLGDGSVRIVHNMGMMQVGTCFNILLGGTRSNPTSWMFGADTAPLFRWFWPLDSELGADGLVYIFAAEMNERGESYLTRVEPTGTYVAAFDPETWNLEWTGQATNNSASLYGWSIESDTTWTYLFAQCHRQFGYDPYVFGVLAHDRSCTDRVTVGRVPLHRMFDAPTYWDGSTWQSDPDRAVPVIDRDLGFALPTQFLFHNNHWMTVTKIDDWWGKEIVVGRSRRPTGPFEEIDRFRPTTKCGLDCNTYFASWATDQNGNDPNAPLTISLSHNRWDGVATFVYRPTFFTIDAPPNVPATADRCSLDHCD